MSVDEILEKICIYMDGLFPTVPFIISPFSGAAPDGKYVAVRMDDVEPLSMYAMKSGASKQIGDKNLSFPYKGLIYFTEVEGDGETIRNIANKVRTKEFLDYCKENNFSFSYMNGNIIDNTVNDGNKFFVSQKYFSLYVSWIDRVVDNTLNILGVDLESTAKDNNEKTDFEVNLP